MKLLLECLNNIIFKEVPPKEFYDLLNKINNIGININQIAKRVNETGSIYEEDIKEIQERLNKIWQLQRTILLTLP